MCSFVIGLGLTSKVTSGRGELVEEDGVGLGISKVTTTGRRRRTGGGREEEGREEDGGRREELRMHPLLS